MSGAGDDRYEAWDGPDRRPETAREWVRWLRTTPTEPVALAREVVSTVGFVVGVGLVLFAISGVWPPMVAVQSGSMEPHMHRGDLVFVVDEERFVGEESVAGTGVVTRRAGANTSQVKFGADGDVVVYRPDGSERRDPIIHRAQFYVQEGENWYSKADQAHVRADSCRELGNCPAPNGGFVTKGDDNDRYDQAMGLSRPVEPSWIEGKAMVRIPWLGHVRLILADAGAVSGTGIEGSSAVDRGLASTGRRAPAGPERPGGLERAFAGVVGVVSVAPLGRRLVRR